jgi:hypothetical protein
MPAYSFKRRFVNPIRVGLGLIPVEPKIVDDPSSASGFSLESKVRPKRQTIRAQGLRRHARPGEIVQLYHGMRTKQCFKIGDGRCTSVHKITMDIGMHSLFIRVDGEPIVSGYIHDFARADGFEHGEDMLAFWHAEHPDISKFAGVLIKWGPL